MREEVSHWSDFVIAQKCAVGETMIRNHRPHPETPHRAEYEQRTFIHPKTGQPTTMKTGKYHGRTNGGQGWGFL